MQLRALLILNIALAGLTLAQAPVKAETMLEKGIELYNAGQYQQAVSALMTAMQQNGNDPAVHYNLGNAFCQMRDYSRALREYQLGWSLSRGGAIGYYCQQAIAGCRQKMAAMATMTPMTRTHLKSVTQMNPVIGNDFALRGVHCPVGTLSSQDGLDKFDSSLPLPMYNEWIKGFDLALRKRASQMVPHIRDWETLSGKCELFLTIDQNRRLRARVERSDTDQAVNAMMLDIVRQLDGSKVLSYDYPIPGFHFWHGIIFDEMVAQLRSQHTRADVTASLTHTSAQLRQNATGLGVQQFALRPTLGSSNLDGTLSNNKVFGRLLTPKALRATQLKLSDMNVDLDLANKEVSAELISKKVGAQLVDPRVGSEIVDRRVGATFGPTGMRANGDLLDPALKEVQGQIMFKDVSSAIVEKGVLGQLMDKGVNGQLIDKGVSGQLMDRSACGQMMDKALGGELIDTGGNGQINGPVNGPVNGLSSEQGAGGP